jgi:hypothetical protein
LTVAASVALTALPLVAISPSASAAPRWAPAATATIHPGVQLFTSGAQCTANFIFYDGAGNEYIGQAAHCSSTGSNTQTNGCSTGSLPTGTPVTITGASKPGTLVYNSWLTMQGLNDTDPNRCQFNDLALVKIDPADTGKVNPSVPYWGGPTATNTAGLTSGQTVYSYGNSELRGGVTQLSPKQGTSNGDNGAGWSHSTVMLLTPGVPGDSGSALLDSAGKATGVLSTLGVSVPGGVTNDFGDINSELSYAAAHAFSVTLAPGDVPFNPNKLPINLGLPGLGLG